MLKKIFAWIVFSSQDPTKLSMTLKSFLVGLVAVVSIVAGFGHFSLPADQTGPIIDALIAAVQSILATVSAITFVYGLIRKLVITVKGQHPMGSFGSIFSR